jgi:hypothetical protein
MMSLVNGQHVVDHTVQALQGFPVCTLGKCYHTVNKVAGRLPD